MSIYRVVVCMGCVAWCVLAGAASAQIKLASFEVAHSQDLTPRVTRVENYTEAGHVISGELAQASFMVDVHRIPFGGEEVRREVTVIYPQLRVTLQEPHEPPAVFGVKYYGREEVPEKIKSMNSKTFVFLLVFPF